MKISYPLLVLAVGTFGIRTMEFSPMGLLPVIMRSVGVSTPAVGVLISAYAAGAMVDAPLTTLLLSHRARCSALIFLMVIFTLGNVLSAIVPDHMTLMLSRILTSLSHGAFFGLGSVVATSVVPKHKQASVIATMSMGLTLANIGGVPAATWLGETIGWRTSSLATTGLGIISMVSLFFSLPGGGVGAWPEVKKELAVLIHPQVLSALLTTVLGAGAVFTLYTYISSVLRSITHIAPVLITAMLVLIGVGSSTGSYLGGKLASRSVSDTLKSSLLLPIVIMLTIPFLTRNEFSTAISMVVWGIVTFVVVLPLQMRVMRVASEAPGLSSSINIGTFNLGNTLRAAADGVVVSAGLGYNFVPAMGAIVTGLALLLVFVSARKQSETVCVADS